MFGNAAQNVMPGDQPEYPVPQEPQQKLGMFGRVGNFLANPNPLFGAGTAVLAASGSPLGEGLFAFQQQARKSRDDEIDRQYKAAQVDYLRNKPQQMSTAARMAAEMGLRPGTPEYQQFIRRYAFKPTILQIPNATGGTDYQEYDPSGGGQAPSLQPVHVEDGFVFVGGDPSNPNSWRQQ